MPYTYAIIKGEEALNKYCVKRWGQLPRFTETIGHCGDATIEYYSLKGKEDEYYESYYLLYMKSDKGTYYNTSNIRRDFLEAVRNGTARLLNS